MSDERHGNLDAEASDALDRLLGMADELGVEMTPGEMMSRALRLYHAVVTGGLTVTPSAELAELMRARGVAFEAVH